MGVLPFAKYKMTMNVWELPPVYVGSSVAMGSFSLHLAKNAMTQIMLTATDARPPVRSKTTTNALEIQAFAL